ncbi:MAG: hypothetical protein ACTSWN_00190, partial [Promethearchaeota archaeon]
MSSNSRGRDSFLLILMFLMGFAFFSSFNGVFISGSDIHGVSVMKLGGVIDSGSSSVNFSGFAVLDSVNYTPTIRLSVNSSPVGLLVGTEEFAYSVSGDDPG